MPKIFYWEAVRDALSEDSGVPPLPPAQRENREGKKEDE